MIILKFQGLKFIPITDTNTDLRPKAKCFKGVYDHEIDHIQKTHLLDDFIRLPFYGTGRYRRCQSFGIHPYGLVLRPRPKP